MNSDSCRILYDQQRYAESVNSDSCRILYDQQRYAESVNSDSCRILYDQQRCAELVNSDSCRIRYDQQRYAESVNSDIYIKQDSTKASGWRVIMFSENSTNQHVPPFRTRVRIKYLFSIAHFIILFVCL